ncbi:hypothetical protein Tco_0191684, partial [Tanacetum coccineum]
ALCSDYDDVTPSDTYSVQAPSGGVTGTAREKISKRATIEILTRPETTSIHEDTEITELHTPKGSKQTEPYRYFH